MFTKFTFVAFFLMLVVMMGGEERAEARSTLTARFAQKGIAGPGIEQTAVLYLHYFPGDGEAVVRTKVRCDAGGVELLGARANLGTARLAGSALEVDYLQRPLGTESVDTLYIDLISAKGKRDIRWSAEIVSSLSADGEVAHTTSVDLEIRPPLELEVEFSPRQVFAGERIDLQVVIGNMDANQRSIEEVVWEWPEGLAVEEKLPSRWTSPLQPGERDTLGWQALVEQKESGPLILRGRAGSVEMSGSPLPEVELRVMALPTARLSATAGPLMVGKPADLVCEWFNDSQETVELEDLRVEIGEAFDGVVVSQKGISTAVGDDEQRRYVLLEGVGNIEPQQTTKVGIQVRPLRPGPFTWKSFARPPGREEFIPLRGKMDVRVIQDLEEGTQAAQPASLTDLQLVSQALNASFQRQVSELPLLPGMAISLRPFAKGDESWVVEDVLGDLLMQQGYRIRLNTLPADSANVGSIYYRLVDARVVYAPLKNAWMPWRKQQQRQAYGDLFLRLESGDGRVRWTGRLQAYDTDQVSSAEMDLLGGGKVVERTIVEPDNKMVERVLSASIIGGLFYIFFLL